MKLADLKRLPVGTRLLLVECLMGPVNPPKARTVARRQSNALAFSGDGIREGHYSWLFFPTASEFKETPDGFAIMEDDGAVGARYTFPKEAE